MIGLLLAILRIKASGLEIILSNLRRMLAEGMISQDVYDDLLDSLD